MAVLDVDYHHGNGTQDIFYDSDTVLYVSLHGDPRCAFPYYWGFAGEVGRGAGKGFNRNVPLPRGTGDIAYLDALRGALELVERHDAAYLVVSLGTDIVRGDSCGGFTLSVDVFADLGRIIGELKVPVLVVQEGGYDTETIGACVALFLLGLEESLTARANSPFRPLE